MKAGCLCGATRFVLRGQPLSSVVCHCRSCRRASGAPSVAWLEFKRDDVELVSDALRHFASSPGVKRFFCERCGTPVLYTNDASPETVDVTTISLDDASQYPPVREVWLEHKVEWEAVGTGRGLFPRGSADGPGPSD